MQSIYEILEYKHPLNIKIFLHKVNAFALHWHRAYELLLILDGKCEITTGKTSVYEKDDLVLINPYIPHSIHSKKGAVILALQIKEDTFGKSMPFDVDSKKNPSDDYSEIKSIMARLIKLHSEHAPGHEILMESLLMLLKYELVTKYRMDSDGVEEFEQYKKHISKISKVLEYVNENFRSDVTLAETANKFFFAPAYLSRIFEKTMGITFKKYLDGLRFTEAMSLLVSTDKSIEEIAFASGFPNVRAFVAMHKSSYGCLPSEYRKGSSEYLRETPKKMQYIDFEKTDYLSEIASYLKGDSSVSEIVSASSEGEVYFDYSFDSSKPMDVLKHNCRNFCTVARASDLLRENVREMLRTAQREIGFKYIKFHGILDDDLSVYTKTATGKIIINFDNIDKIFDFLLSINLRPLVQLSFMPKAMAKYPDKKVFFHESIISEPENYYVWGEFIGKLIHHLLTRYGLEEVEKWLFSLWNEPESPPDMFGFYDKDTYTKFYRVTYKSVKSIAPTIKFGSPSFMYDSITKKDIFENFIKDVSDCPPDFINLHFYPVDGSFDDSNAKNLGAAMKLISDPYILEKTISKIKEKLLSLGLSSLPIYLTEWNFTTSHRDLLNDTAFKGSYIARNIMDNYDNLDSFGYWTLTDDMYELPLENKLFHGGLGMFTSSGIKKPAYYAFSFLSKLGKNLIGKAKGIMATEDIRGFQIMLVNYVHYSDLYASGESFGITESDRYTVFRSAEKKNFSVKINNVINGTYIIEEYFVNRNGGSVFDTWLNSFHGEEAVTPASMEALKEISHPSYSLTKVEVKDGSLTYRASTEPHEIRLALIKRL